MGFLKRLRGGGEPGGRPRPDEPAEAGGMDEQARERELLLEEARRLDDDLLQRQLRYADRSWTPPPQGGPRRAGDEESGEPDG